MTTGNYINLRIYISFLSFNLTFPLAPLPRSRPPLPPPFFLLHLNTIFFATFFPNSGNDAFYPGNDRRGPTPPAAPPRTSPLSHDGGTGGKRIEVEKREERREDKIKSSGELP